MAMRIAAVLLAAVAAAIVVSTIAPAQPGYQLWGQQLAQTLGLQNDCDRLPGLHGQMCSEYAVAVGENKWDAAIAWRQASRETYECSGIEADCLHEDMHSSKAGTSCKPLSDGSDCGFGKQCKQGFCGGPTPALLAKTATMSLNTKSYDEPASATDDYTDSISSEADAAESTLAADTDTGFDAANVSETNADDLPPRILAQQRYQRKASKQGKQSMKRKQNANRNQRMQRMNALQRSKRLMSYLQQPIPVWPYVTASVYIGPTGNRVLDTFLATSHEYTRIQDYGDARQADAWGQIFSKLSAQPVLRVGGASQDKMIKVPSDDVWQSLKVLQKHTNCRFVIGLPLFQSKAVEMGRDIIKKSQQYLGGYIIGYELGNEPEFWPTGLGGYDKSYKWKSGFDAYASWFHRVAMALNPCGSGMKILSGPGWGNVNTQPTKWLADIMYKGKDCYLRELNVHYYPYINNETVTAKELLSEPLQQFGLQKFSEYQKLAAKEKLGVRISETNSLYGGGRADLSDTMVGCLWVADALFAFARAGATAFHLHWGQGGHPSGELGQPNTGVQTNFHFDVSPGQQPVPWPSVHAPWYGYLFWTLAAAGDYGKKADTQFVQATIDDKGKCSANIKIWALKADNKDLRIALLNKDEKTNCNMKILVEKMYCSKQASLTRMLPGMQGMYSKGGITIQGQTYENAGYTGQIQGLKQEQKLAAIKYKDGKCGFEVPLPSASGAILIARWW